MYSLNSLWAFQANRDTWQLPLFQTFNRNHSPFHCLEAKYFSMKWKYWGLLRLCGWLVLFGASFSNTLRVFTRSSSAAVSSMNHHMLQWELQSAELIRMTRRKSGLQTCYPALILVSTQSCHFCTVTLLSILKVLLLTKWPFVQYVRTKRPVHATSTSVWGGILMTTKARGLSSDVGMLPKAQGSVIGRMKISCTKESQRTRQLNDLVS